MIVKAPRVLTIEDPKDEAFLHTPTLPIDFSKVDRDDLKKKVALMRAAMAAENGVGISANQIGINMMLFLANVNKKLYVIANPKVVSTSEEMVISRYEGCLSVPRVFKDIPRYKQITITGQNIDGKEARIKVKGFASFVFQHEIDHLNGILFIDRYEERKDVLKKLQNNEKE